ncbi:hypothetical protein ES703_73453 [subsurface metagenome]
MPILYPETIPTRLQIQKHKYTPRALRQVRALQEAHRWRVVEHYAVNSIKLTLEQLTGHIREGLEKGCAKKNCVLESFKVLQVWTVWKILYNEYHIRYEAVIRGSPVPYVVIVLVLAILLTVIIIFGVWLVNRELIEPLLDIIPPELKGVVVTALVFGVAAVLIGGGLYLGTRWLRARRK